MINLTLLTKLPQWWRSLSVCLWAVRVPVTEFRLIYSVKCKKKKKKEILKSFSVIQIRWAGKDHRRLSCLHCVSVSTDGRNRHGKRGILFHFLGYSLQTVGTFFQKSPPPASLPSLSPPMLKCYEKMSLESVTSAWERQSVGVGGFWEREDL